MGGPDFGAPNLRQGLPMLQQSQFESYAAKLGTLVTRKNEQYGDSVASTSDILAKLYPDGVQPHQYRDMLLVTRILDKLCRVAQRGADGKHVGGESPFQDIAGYGLLGMVQDDG